MKKKIMAAILSFVFVINLAVMPVVATSNKEDLQEVKDKVSDAKEKKNKVTAEKETVLNEISDLEDSIEDYEDELEQLQTKITKLEGTIKDKNEEIEKLEEEYKEKQKLLEDRLVAIYEEGQVTFLDVLLSAENIWDYISLGARIEELTVADNEIMEKVDEERLSVQKAKKELEEQKTQLNTAKKSAEAKQKQLKVTKNTKEVKVANLTKEQKKLQSEIEKYNKEIDRIEEEIRKAALNSSNKYQGNFNGVLSWPVSSSSPYYNNITSYFGNREQPVPGASTYHRAIDIGLPVGTGIYSAADGYVVTKGYSSVRGYYVMVKHADNLYTFYQHLSSILVSSGQNVKRGQQIAKSGSSGIGSGPHLHFEVRTGPYYGSEVNPLNYTHW